MIIITCHPNWRLFLARIDLPSRLLFRCILQVDHLQHVVVSLPSVEALELVIHVDAAVRTKLFQCV